MEVLDARALPLLRELMDLTHSEREARLGERAGDEPLLRARVRTLLALVDERDTRPSEPDAGAGEFGPYRIVKLLGQGGMGEVFLAERADGAFERQVALKRIWGGFGSLAERFARERQILARLSHPHIAQLYDGGLTERGQPWFAMEYVDGAPITDWCERQCATLSQRVTLIEQLCAAVQLAHSNLVVHRDIKPANVLIGADGQPKLLDFGIAKLLDEASPLQTQTLLMTPAWAAPEQRMGAPLTTASDVYQLGLLLRALLVGESGRQPAALHERLPGLLASYRQLRQRDPAEALALAKRRGLNPERLGAQLQGDLDAMVALATAEDPLRRYTSPAALAEDLRRWQRGYPVQARKDVRGYRLRRWLRRRWPLLAGTAAALSMLAVHSISLDRELARTERERATAAAMAEFLVSVFRSGTPAQIRDSELSARALLHKSVAQLRQPGREAPSVRAAMLVSAGKIYMDQSLFGEAESLQGEAVRLLRADPASSAETLASALHSWAKSLLMINQPDKSLNAALEAVSLSEQAADPASIKRGEILGFAAFGLFIKKDLARSRALFAESLAILAKHQQAAPLSYVEVLTNAAHSEQLRGDKARALSHFREARALAATVKERDPRAFIGTSVALAALLRDDGAHAEAVTLLQDAAQQARRYYGEQHAEMARIADALALTYLAQGHLDKAHASSEKAEATALAVYGPAHNRSQKTQLTALAVAMARKNYGAARRYIELLRASPTQTALVRLADKAIVCARTPSAPRHLSLQQAMASAAPAFVEPYQRQILQRWLSACQPVTTSVARSIKTRHGA